MKTLQLIACYLMLAMTSFSQAKKSDLLESLSNMRREASNNSVNYYDQTSPSTTNANAFYLYIVKPNNQPPELKLRIQYFGATKLGVYEYSLKNNDNTLRLFADYIHKENVGYGDLKSWCDIDVTTSVLEFLRSINTLSPTKLKYVGAYNMQRKLIESEVQALFNVIRLYDLLSNLEN
jgi:hypothetical protein